MDDEIKKLISYFRELGIEVHTTTKARGNQGFYMNKRIDISKNISKERVIPVLLHEFAHYIHSLVEPEMEKSGGSIEKIFDDSDIRFYKDELLTVTGFVDKNSKCEILKNHKESVKEKIGYYENIIKERYPDFQRSKKFKEFEKYIKNSNARYLLKYDRVVVKGLSKHSVMYSVDNIEKDFYDMPKEFVAYIRLHSYQKRQSKISAKINRMNKYYSKPTELFARFVEGLYLDCKKIKEIAPNSTKRFFELLDCGYYGKLYNLKNLFEKN